MDVYSIIKAKVPVGMFRSILVTLLNNWESLSVISHDPQSGIGCNISTNNTIGLRSTALVKAYCDLAPDIVAPMIFAIKRWRNPLGLNNSTDQDLPPSFSSHTLSLMVIGYLQVRQKHFSS